MAKWMCEMCGGIVSADEPPDHHEDHATDWINVTHAYRAGQRDLRTKAAQCRHDFSTQLMDPDATHVLDRMAEKILTIPLEGDE